MLETLKNWISKLICKRDKDLDRLFSKPNVHTVCPGTKKVSGEDTGEPAVKVYVESKKSGEELSSQDLIPKSVKGVKTDVEEAPMPEAQADRTRYDDLRGGIEIGLLNSPYVGTVGNFYAQRSYVTIRGKKIYLYGKWLGIINLLERWGLGPEIEKEIIGTTNLHVASDSVLNPKKGRVVTQPGTSNRRIGKVIDWEDIDPDGYNEFDWAIFKVYKNELDGLKGNIKDIGRVKDVLGIKDGSFRRKRGRTTEYTEGNHTKYPIASKINYGDDGVIKFKNLGMIYPTDDFDKFSDKGDSGSDIVDGEGNLRGKLFAGNGTYTLYHPVDKLFKKYKLSLINLLWTDYREKE